MVKKFYDFVFVNFFGFVEGGKRSVLVILDEKAKENYLFLFYIYNAAKLLRGIKRSYYFGIVFDYVKFDYMMMKSQFMLHKSKIMENLKELFQKLNIDLLVISRKEFFIDRKSNRIVIKDKEINYKKLMSALEVSKEFKHPILKPDNHTSFLAHDFIKFNRNIERVVIYGSGSFSYSLSSLLGNLSGIEVFHVLSNKPFLYDLQISDELKEIAKRRLIEDLKINLIENDDPVEYWHKENKAFLRLKNYGLIENIDIILLEENEEVNHKEMFFVFGIPSISYRLPKSYSNVKILKPNKLLLNVEEDIIKVYVDDKDIVKGYEIVANDSEVFAYILDRYIKHKLPFDRFMDLLEIYSL